MASKLKDYVIETPDGHKRVRRLSTDHKERIEKRLKKVKGASITTKADEVRKQRLAARNKQRDEARNKSRA